MSAFTPAGSGGAPLGPIVINGVTTPQITNVNLTLSGTEYTVVLNNIKRFLIKARGGAILQLRYVSAGDYLTISPGVFMSEDNISAGAVTFYVSSSVAAEVLEIITWS